ncbi:MAG: DUF58 domain-containing protein [Filimonas sp.]|nr:DUF58 domain-containing protein [Filimonas sp.]
MNVFRKNDISGNPATTGRKAVDTGQVLKKVRELEIKSKRLSNHLFTGEYHSAFKGRGMSFKEVREYQPGDDIRFIEWNVSARMGHTYSKLFEEERELTVYLLVDVSASSMFGTFQQTKRDLMTEVCAVLAFAAMSNGDKVGLIFFSDKVEKYIPAKKGKEHVLYMVRELLSFEPSSAKTDIIKALQFLNRTTRRMSIVFLLSDFVDSGYRDALRIAAKRNDVIGVQMYDKKDKQLPKVGLIQIEDPETGQKVWLDTNDTESRIRYNQQFTRILNEAKQTFKNAGADFMQLATGEDYVKSLKEFFIRRA